MAIYHMSAKCVQRSKGRSSTASAAYRAGEKIKNKLTGELYDYSKKQGVLHSEIIAAIDESISREELWNLAEASEKRKDATTAKEFVIALPDELNQEQRKTLVRDFANHIAKSQGCAVDISIHAPGKGDDRNHHAHLLCTTREVQPGGTLGGKCKMELSDRDRKKLGLPGRKSDLEGFRATWAQLANQALTRAGHVGDLDHRSNQERGLSYPGGIHMGPTAAAMERRGVRTDRGDRQREISEVKNATLKLETATSVSARIDGAFERVKNRRNEREEAVRKAAQKRREREQEERQKKQEIEREKIRQKNNKRGGWSR